MEKWFENNIAAVGRTPLVKLNRVINEPHVTVLAKIESRNAAFSVKDRIGVAMVEDAIAKGILTDGKEIVEATSGNTGVALSYVAAAKGFPITIIMPDTMSIERRKLIVAYGARLILTPGSEGMKGAIAKAKALADSDKKYVLLNQFTNQANAKVHEETTGPEIWAQTDGKMDILISGVGTGGTIMGVSRYFKETKNKKITSIAVEPAASPVITQAKNAGKLVPGPHKIQGLGAGFIPEIVELDLIDTVVQVTDEEALDCARRLAREEGILAGISSGAAVAAAKKVAKKPESQGKIIVVVLPDSGERYLSSILFDGLFDKEGNPL